MFFVLGAAGFFSIRPRAVGEALGSPAERAATGAPGLGGCRGCSAPCWPGLFPRAPSPAAAWPLPSACRRPAGAGLWGWAGGERARQAGGGRKEGASERASEQAAATLDAPRGPRQARRAGQVAGRRWPPFLLPPWAAGETMRLGAPGWVGALLLLLHTRPQVRAGARLGTPAGPLCARTGTGMRRSWAPGWGTGRDGGRHSLFPSLPFPALGAPFQAAAGGRRRVLSPPAPPLLRQPAGETGGFQWSAARGSYPGGGAPAPPERGWGDPALSLEVAPAPANLASPCWERSRTRVKAVV